MFLCRSDRALRIGEMVFICVVDSVEFGQLCGARHMQEMQDMV